MGQLAMCEPFLLELQFERLGWRGWYVLERVIQYARDAGLLILLDAKRGDIADTATGYAQAYLASDAPCGVDAVTANPYMGPESLEPFMAEAERAGRGVIVLIRNSNSDSSVYQCVDTSVGPFFTVVASSLAQWHERLARGRTGWSSMGVTVAATHSEDSETIREARSELELSSSRPFTVFPARCGSTATRNRSPWSSVLS